MALKEEDVGALRKMFRSGMGATQIAEHYGVNYNNLVRFAARYGMKGYISMRRFKDPDEMCKGVRI